MKFIFSVFVVLSTFEIAFSGVRVVRQAFQWPALSAHGNRPNSGLNFFGSFGRPQHQPQPNTGGHQQGAGHDQPARQPSIGGFVDSFIPNSGNTGNQQGGSVGGIVDSFIGGIFGGRPGTSNNQGHPSINFNPDPCADNGGCEHICENLGTRRRCQCKEGFVLNDDFKTCSDIDECSLRLNRPCQDKCTNTIGSYECSCGGQAILLPDKRSCIASGPSGPGPAPVPAPAPVPDPAPGPVPVAPIGQLCGDNNGGCEQNCVDQSARIECSCNPPFQLARDGFSCFKGKTESCDIANGGCEHRCRTSRKGIVRCACKKNFNVGADGVSCVPKDPNARSCDKNKGGCQHRCHQSKKGNIRCSCKRNFELQPDGLSCKSTASEPIITDPCRQATCDHNCRVVNKLAECYCNRGYHLQNGKCAKDQVIVPPPPGPPPPKPPPPGPPPQAPPVLPGPPPPPSDLPHLPIVTENRKCGINRVKSVFQRIVGGEEAHKDDWSWMVAMLFKGAKSSFCGGSLISPMFVLTAAHCVSSFTKDEIIVRLGVYDFDIEVVGADHDYDIAEIRMHEDYDTLTTKNDIALLKLARPVKPGKRISTICLPKKGAGMSKYVGQLGISTGFGTMSYGGQASNVLRQVTLPFWAENDCKEAYGDKIYQGMFCAGYKQGGRDSCQGDSGGPFNMQDPTTYQFYLGGIVSWGIECASANKPGVYTLVEDYLQWIHSHTN